MKARSIKGRSTEEIKTALEESMADGFKPTLAIVFISVKQDREAISGLLDKKGIQVFGATTAGEFIDGEMEAGSIVMLLLDMDPVYFKIEFLETSQETAFEDAIKLGIAGKETFANPAFIIANSGVALDGEPFVEGIIQAFGKEVSIFGGKAADDLALESTFV
ncbi:MAG: FIST N-terminal domain-containing protein, partial [Ferruginibacter sp.]